MNFSFTVNFEDLMEPVVERLIEQGVVGEKNEAMSKPPKDVRFGTHGSLSVDYTKGCYFDHEDNRGGNIMDLIKHKLNTDHQGAKNWLREERILRPSDTPDIIDVEAVQRNQQAGAEKKTNGSHHNGSGNGGSSQFHEVAKFEYVNTDGVVVFRAVRLENSNGDKEFRQHRWLGDGKWAKNLDGLTEEQRRIPYNLPAVIEAVAKGQPVWIVEGEGKVEGLRKLGIVACCNAGGSKKWYAEHSAHMKDGDVVISGDNDTAGEEHVAKILETLPEVAKRIRVASLIKRWPELKAKGDVVDVIRDHGATAEQLWKLAEEAPDWKPSDETGEEQASAAPEPSHTEPTPDWPIPEPDVFHGILGEIVEAIDPHTEADRMAILLHTMAMIGNAIGRGPHLRLESTRHGMNLFLVFCGVTSKGRKGTAGDRALDVVKDVDLTWSSRIVGGLSSGEGFVYQIRDPVQKWNIKEKKYEISDPGVTDKRLLVIEPEFASVLRVCERQGSTLSINYRHAWDGKPLGGLTKAEPTRCKEHHVSIIGHITMAELCANLTRTDMANGMANRNIFVLIRRSKKLPMGGNLQESDLAPFRERLATIVARAQRVGLVTLTEGRQKDLGPRLRGSFGGPSRSAGRSSCQSRDAGFETRHELRGD